MNVATISQHTDLTPTILKQLVSKLLEEQYLYAIENAIESNNRKDNDNFQSCFTPADEIRFYYSELFECFPKEITFEKLESILNNGFDSETERFKFKEIVHKHFLYALKSAKRENDKRSDYQSELTPMKDFKCYYSSMFEKFPYNIEFSDLLALLAAHEEKHGEIKL